MGTQAYVCDKYRLASSSLYVALTFELNNKNNCERDKHSVMSFTFIHLEASVLLTVFILDHFHSVPFFHFSFLFMCVFLFHFFLFRFRQCQCVYEFDPSNRYARNKLCQCNHSSWCDICCNQSMHDGRLGRMLVR